MKARSPPEETMTLWCPGVCPGVGISVISVRQLGFAGDAG